MMTNRSILLAGVVLFLAGGVASLHAIGAEQLSNLFFAMDTGTRDASHQTPEEQASLAREVGFKGVGPIYHSPEELQQWLAAVDKLGLKMVALYVPLRLDNLEPSLATVQEVAALLRGRDTMLWVFVTDKKHKAAAADNDETAVKALQQTADLAKQAGLRVALYPHTGFYVERVEDAVRLIGKAGRSNVGLTFNLCHWLKVDGKDLKATLSAARPHLFCVSINGADAGGTNWKQLIRPLGCGTYDVAQVLRLLRKMDYNGPIGLQHYGIGGDAKENLSRSMASWKKLSAIAAAKE
jgi:sugar phosphate isomerase/epimerase